MNIISVKPRTWIIETKHYVDITLNCSNTNTSYTKYLVNSAIMVPKTTWHTLTQS